MRFLIGPAFYNWSETQRMAYIAECLVKLGNDVTFIGEGKYDYLLDDVICDRVVPNADKMWHTDERIAKMLNPDKYGNDYASEAELEEIVNQEVEIINEVKPDSIITGYRMSLNISSQIAKVPLVWCLSAVVSPMFFEKGLATIPEGISVNHFLKDITDPELKKHYYAKFATMNALSNNKKSQVWNTVRSKYHLPKLTSDIRVFEGDLNIMSDAPELYQEFDTKDSSYKFCGPFRPRNEKMTSDSYLDNYDSKGRKTVLVIMGSSVGKNILLEVLESIKDLDYSFLVATLGLLTEGEIAKFPSKFHFEKTYPVRKAMSKADVCVIHGGQGLLYSAVFEGKPFVGVPMFNEQQYNLSNIVKKAQNGICILKNQISQGKVADAIHNVIEDESYSENAKKLSRVMEKYEKDTARAEDKAAQIIMSFAKSRSVI